MEAKQQLIDILYSYLDPGCSYELSNGDSVLLGEVEMCADGAILVEIDGQTFFIKVEKET